jgi:hypothetical protein
VKCVSPLPPPVIDTMRRTTIHNSTLVQHNHLQTTLGKATISINHNICTSSRVHQANRVYGMALIHVDVKSLFLHLFLTIDRF